MTTLGPAPSRLVGVVSWRIRIISGRRNEKAVCVCVCGGGGGGGGGGWWGGCKRGRLEKGSDVAI